MSINTNKRISRIRISSQSEDKYEATQSKRIITKEIASIPSPISDSSDFPELDSLCQHENLDTYGICTSCGEIVMSNGNDEWSRYRTSKVDRSIKNDIEKMAFTQDIKIRADLIYHTMNSTTHRGRRRKQLLFYCIYNACKELKVHYDPKYIANQIGITDGDMTKALSLFSEVQTGYSTSTSGFTTPLDYIPDYCRQIGLTEEAIDDVNSLAIDIINKDKTLRDSFPHTVAAGILKYYTLIRGLKIDNKVYASVVGLSEATVSTIYRRISSIDNK